MKPTLFNAFNDRSAEPGKEASASRPASSSTSKGANAWPSRRRSNSPRPLPGNPRKSLAASLSPMQADLRETEFGWSLELSPMTAVDALEALAQHHESAPLTYLVNMEQSAWREGEADMPVAEVARRLAIPVIESISSDQLVLEEVSLRQLVSLCQPTRLLVMAVAGDIDQRDAIAMNQAIEAGRSPMWVELRAVAALEVLGDRGVVLHCRDKEIALRFVAENFRHYLAALHDRPQGKFAAPEPWQVERLLSLSGMLTVRPVETQMFSTSVDVGINTSRDRFGRPADRSLIYDVPSNTWHDEA